MSTTTTTAPAPAQPQTQTPQQAQLEQRLRLLYRVSLGAVIICPALALLPPRKLDLYTFLLATCTGMGGNELLRQHTGRSAIQRIKDSTSKTFNDLTGEELPSERARMVSEQIRKELAFKEAQKRAKERGEDVTPMGVRELIEQDALERSKGLKGKLKEVWLGGEGDDWKKKRDQREKEALEAGKGYGDLIMEQIWDVWSWGKKSAEEVKEKDEAVVEARKENAQKEEKR